MKRTYQNNPFFFLIIILSLNATPVHALTVVDDFCDFVTSSFKKIDVGGILSIPSKIMHSLRQPLEYEADFFIDEDALPNKFPPRTTELAKQEQTPQEPLSQVTPTNIPDAPVYIPSDLLIDCTAKSLPQQSTELTVAPETIQSQPKVKKMALNRASRQLQQERKIQAKKEPFQKILTFLEQEEAGLLSNQKNHYGELAEHFAQEANEQNKYANLHANYATAKIAHSDLLDQKRALDAQIENSIFSPIARLLYTAQNSSYAWYLSIAAKSSAAAAGGYVGHTLYRYFLEHYFAAKKLSPQEVKKLRNKINTEFHTKKIEYDLLVTSLQNTVSPAEEQQLLAKKVSMEKDFDKIKAQLTALQLNLDPAHKPQQSELQKAASWASYATSIIGSAYGGYATALAIGNCSAVTNLHELDAVKKQLPESEKNSAALRHPLEISSNKLAEIEEKIIQKKKEEAAINNALTVVINKKKETQKSLDKLSSAGNSKRSKEERQASIALQEKLRKKNSAQIMLEQPELYN